MAGRYCIGVDFGTESGRATLVDLATGDEVATAVYEYENGVIDEHLPAPDDDVRLTSDWALQDPQDYIRTFQIAVRSVLAQSGVDPADVIGIGTDFTACTMLPTTADGTPLCELAQFRRRPHAWVKLWKHHAAQPQADRINAVARERGEPWLARYGGKISSEWFYAKSLQILEEAPDLYAAAGRLIEAADWVIWQLTGVETRNNCTAGYKAIWSKRDGFPPAAYFAALDPRFEHVVDEKMSRKIDYIGARAGVLTPRAAEWTGLRPGTVVAVGNVDAHVSVPAATVARPGTMVAIMGTSICHIVLGQELANVEGMCGVVEDGVVPGLFGYEAGQSAVGDIFAWFVENAVPPEYHDRARAAGSDVHRVLEADAAALAPRRVRPARARLVERQPVRARRRRPHRTAARRDARNEGAGDLPGADRGDRVRHPDDRRRVRGERRRGQRDRGRRRTAGAQPAPDADLRGRDRSRAPGAGVEPDAGAGLGDVRGRRRRTRARAATTASARRRLEWPGCSDTSYHPDPARPRGLRRAVSGVPRRCTTTSAAARTT